MAATDNGARTSLASMLEDLLGTNLPIAIRAYDGSHLGPPEDEAPATIIVRSPDALRRIVTAPGELGFGRAYVAGDLDVEGDIFEALKLGDHIPGIKLSPKQWAAAAKLVGIEGLKPLPPPPEEARLRGRRHSKERDAAAIRHHYDVVERLLPDGARAVDDLLVRGVREAERHPRRRTGSRSTSSSAASSTCSPGMRLLDVGCGWGGMVMHAARHHGVRGRSASRSRRRRPSWRGAGGRGGPVRPRRDPAAGLPRRRRRPVRRDQLDRHVRARRAGEARRVLPPLHEVAACPAAACSTTASAGRRSPAAIRGSVARSFIDRYVFPDGELHEVGTVVSRDAAARASRSATSRACASTTRSRCATGSPTSRPTGTRPWISSASGRARVWRLYMAASAVNFERGRTQIHQILGVKPDAGASHMPLRPDWGA